MKNTKIEKPKIKKCDLCNKNEGEYLLWVKDSVKKICLKCLKKN